MSKAWIPVLAVLIVLAFLAAPSAAQSTPPAKKVVLLSIDALRADMVWQLLSNQTPGAPQLPGFRYIAEHGYIAKGMIVSFPSSTAVSHAVISTGAPPAVTGITGNAMHLPGTPLTSLVSGFNGSLLLAEPLWMTADRQGLTAVVAAFPQSNPSAWEGKMRRSMVFNPYDSSMGPPTYSTLYTSNRSVPAATYVDVSPALNWTGSLPGVSVVKAWEASFSYGDEAWFLYIADTNGDERPDVVAVVPRVKDLGAALTVLREGEWSKPLNTTLTYKGVSYVVAPLFKAVNLSLDNLRVYRSLTRPFESAARWFSDRQVAWRVWNEVVARVGFITDGDYYGLANGWFDEDTYMETVYYANTFFMEFTRWLIRNTNWDLLMTYTPIVDNVYHEFLGMTDPRMPYYDPVKAPKYWGYILRTIQWADQFVQMILSEVDLTNTAVVVVSDHGQWPVAKLVYVNNILEQAGLLKRSGSTILLNETLAYYTGYNQVFINLKGREAGGIVDPADYDRVVNNVMSVLASTRDPDTGEPVFSVVMKKSEAASLGLWGDRVGDIVISCKPGYAPWGGILRAGSPFVNVTPLKTITANHQDLPLYPELHAVFAAVGAGVGHGVLGLVYSTSVAPTVAALLGIEPPLNSTGTPLPVLKPWTTTVTETQSFTATTTFTQTQTVTATVTATTTFTKPEVVTATERYVDAASTTIIAAVALVEAAAIVLLARRGK
ncbi:alkaline phosphatase family protein [Desulfurococcus mucosus]|uniref:Type I phosphodiesterase/nucleotide pyrophosphatase n=1 Tax=Desulfurococcus mucosus (strain ATCC 35584 / DSM 2162 / JCM 9187 / O7/1) TaxID=765177 RepID=E8R8D8_DESM0|nr:alkaline phosphatase family protein [Desulfurococcus mucosus]ADV64764.1 type I phosphodiesterase/nucleotide pyrophosphatase [Desulfurococcus mucosus DSM 2162]